MRERPQVVAAIAAGLEPHPLPCHARDLPDHLRRDYLPVSVIDHGLCPLGIGLRLISKRLETGDTLLQCQVLEVRHTRFDGVVKALQPQIRVGCALVQFRNVLTTSPGALLTAVKDRGKHLLQSLGLEQPLLDV